MNVRRHLTDFAVAWSDMDRATPRQGVAVCIGIGLVFMLAALSGAR